jgi:hypothetical protein
MVNFLVIIYFFLFVPSYLVSAERKSKSPIPQITSDQADEPKIKKTPASGRKKNSLKNQISFATPPKETKKSLSGSDEPRPAPKKLLKLTLPFPHPKPTPSQSSSRENSPRSHESPRDKISPRLSPKKNPSHKIDTAKKEYMHAIKTLTHADTLNLEQIRNPNELITTKTTLLHLAVLTHSLEEVYPFIHDARINSLVMNDAKCMAIDCLDDKTTTLYNELKLRKWLDYIINALIMTQKTMRTEKTSYKAELSLSSALMRYNDPLPGYASNSFIYEMTTARYGLYKATIEDTLTQQNINPNHQDEWGNTQLHYFVYLKDKEAAESLVTDPVVNTSIANIDNLMAYQITESKKFQLLLYKRYQLDNFIKPEKNFNQGYEDQEIINDSLKEIKDYFKGSDGSNTLPQYADNVFLRKMIRHRLADWESRKKILPPHFIPQDKNLELKSKIVRSIPDPISKEDQIYL